MSGVFIVAAVLSWSGLVGVLGNQRMSGRVRTVATLISALYLFLFIYGAFQL